MDTVTNRRHAVDTPFDTSGIDVEAFYSLDEHAIETDHEDEHPVQEPVQEQAQVAQGIQAEIGATGTPEEIYYYPTKINWNHSWPKIIAIRTKEILYLTYRCLLWFGTFPDGMRMDEEFENSWQFYVPPALSYLIGFGIIFFGFNTLYKDWRAKGGKFPDPWISRIYEDSSHN